MALPSSYGIEKNRNSLEGLRAYENGGKGSGNWGHAGRPGEVGGSAPSGSSSANYESKSQSEREIRDRIDELTQKISYAAKAKQDGESVDEDWVSSMMEERKQLYEQIQSKKSGEGETKADEKGGKYSVKDGKDARKYLTDDAGTSLGMLWEVGVSPENYGFTYDELGKPTRLSRFEKDADDKLWRAWASMQKVQDNPDTGDVRGEGLATSHDALRLAKAVIATSQTAYLPSERKVAQEQNEKFVKGVKDEVKKQKLRLTADSKKYGETDARKATRKALDDISSAMDGFIGYDRPSREYKD